jgi:hypothetical protein
MTVTGFGSATHLCVNITSSGARRILTGDLAKDS